MYLWSADSYLDVCCARDISTRLSNGASCRLPPGGASGVCVVSEGYQGDTLPLLKKLDHSSLSYRFSLPRPLSLYFSTDWWITGRSDNPSNVQCRKICRIWKEHVIVMTSEWDISWSLRSAALSHFWEYMILKVSPTVWTNDTNSHLGLCKIQNWWVHKCEYELNWPQHKWEVEAEVKL